MVLKIFIMLCSHHHHPSSPEPFSSCKTKALYPSNDNSSFPLPPQLLATTILFSVSMNLTTTLLYVSGVIQYLCFCDSFLFLNIKSSIFHHIVPYIRISFLLKLEQKFYSILNTYILYVLGCFRVLAIGNNDAMNMGAKILTHSA